MLLGDEQFVCDMQTAISKLENRVGESDDIKELKDIVKKVKLLIKPTPTKDGRETKNDMPV